MKVSAACILLSTSTLIQGFSTISSSTRAPRTFALNAQKPEIESFDPLNLSTENTNDSLRPEMMSAIALIALSPEVANAAGPDWGIFEGRSLSLLHPLIMGGTFLLSLSAGLKGFQYRRQRTMGTEISALKKTLPDLGGASTLSAAIANAQEAEDLALVSQLQRALPIQQEIDSLTEERKSLASMNLRDNHFSQGATLAFFGTAFAIEGPLNTYARAGKLFPGPHLYAGAGLVVLWAAAAACVPAMQKGNDTARSIHIAANALGVGLFAWQIVTGLQITEKVIQFTKWP